MKNYSRQREAILAALRSTNTHPTANWIYEKVRKDMPNISLGTVYRNLSELSANGEILCLDVGEDALHYDADISPHIHLQCKRCKNIVDIKIDSDFAADIAFQNGFVPENSVYVVYGVCKNCKSNGGNLK